jgi:hypothetical protein
MTTSVKAAVMMEPGLIAVERFPLTEPIEGAGGKDALAAPATAALAATAPQGGADGPGTLVRV